jgi:hypothetical protein
MPRRAGAGPHGQAALHDRQADSRGAKPRGGPAGAVSREAAGFGLPRDCRIRCPASVSAPRFQTGLARTRSRTEPSNRESRAQACPAPANWQPSPSVPEARRGHSGFCRSPEREPPNSPPPPAAIRRAVSRQRHQGEDRIRSTRTPRERKASPSALACARPSSSRFRCVVQSSTLKPGGSPPWPGDVPGALPWRIRATWPPATSAPQASVASWAAPAGVMVNDTARAARASRARRRAMPRSIMTRPGAMPRSIMTRPGAMPRSIMTPSRPRLFIRVTTIDLLAVSTNTGGHVRHRVPAETGAGRAYERASPSVRPPPRNSTPHCTHRDDGAHPSTLSRVRGGQWVVAGGLTDRRVLV